MDGISVTDPTESTLGNRVNLLNQEPSSWQKHAGSSSTVEQPAFGLDESSALTREPHRWILLRTLVNKMLFYLQNKNNRVCSFDVSDRFEPFAACGQQGRIFPLTSWTLDLSLTLFLSVVLPKFSDNWFWPRRHVSTQAEENQDFGAAVLHHHIYNISVQLHIPRPVALLLQVRFPPFGQLFLQRSVRLSPVYDGGGGWPLVHWALQPVHSPLNDQREQRPVWWNLQVVAGKIQRVCLGDLWCHAAEDKKNAHSASVSRWGTKKKNHE